MVIKEKKRVYLVTEGDEKLEIHYWPGSGSFVVLCIRSRPESDLKERAKEWILGLDNGDTNHKTSK